MVREAARRSDSVFEDVERRYLRLGLIRRAACASCAPFELAPPAPLPGMREHGLTESEMARACACPAPSPNRKRRHASPQESQL